MKKSELIKILEAIDGDFEVKLFYWDEHLHKYRATHTTAQTRKHSKGVWLLAEQEEYEPQQCMVGGHGEGCMCNLGFTPRWRDKNDSA